MAEPTSAYSLSDLILRVAKAASVAYYGSSGSSVAMVPVDEEVFQRCLNCVNDGIKMFIASAPQEGWRWQDRTMTVTLAPSYTGTAESGSSTTLVDSTIANTYADDFFNGYVLKITAGTGIGETATITDYTGSTGTFTFAALSGGSTPDSTSEYRISRSTSVIDADPARYQLADDFQGEVAGAITYAADTGHGTHIDWVDESYVRAWREVQVLTAYPQRAAIRPYTSRTWELIMDPAPSAADVLTFPYRAGFAAMAAVSGTASAASSTTLVNSSIANLYPDDYFNSWTISIIDGTGRNSYAVVTDYAGSTGTFTVADWLSIDGSAGGTDPAANSSYFATNGTKHPAGMQFDEAVLAACLAKAELEFEDLQMGYMNKFLTFDLPKAYGIDARSAPKKLGQVLPGRRSERRTRTFNDITYNGS